MDNWAQWNHPLQRPDVSYYGFDLAAERGRRMAAEAIRCDPANKARCEAQFGLAACKQRWPEAYAGPAYRFFGGLFDKMRGK